MAKQDTSRLHPVPGLGEIRKIAEDTNNIKTILYGPDSESPTSRDHAATGGVMLSEGHHARRAFPK